MATNQYIIATAKDVHAYLQMVCEERGAPEVETKHGPGWTIESIPLGAWVKDVGDGNQLKKRYVVDLVRNYLTASGNVVILKKLQVHPAKFRLFVRKTWNDATLVRQSVGNLWGSPAAERDRREAKLTAQEAGEDREPAPVTHRDLWEEFKTYPLSDTMLEILTKLHAEHGGKYTFGSRESVEDGLDLTNKVTGSAAGTVKALVERGLVEYRNRHPRQYDWLKLTSLGSWAAQHAEYLGTGERALLAYLKAHKGKFVASSVSRFSKELGDLIHKHPKTVSDAVRKLEADGVVTCHHPTGSNYIGSIELVGYEEEPKVTDLPDEELASLEPEEDPVDVEVPPEIEPEYRDEPTNGHVVRTYDPVAVSQGLEQTNNKVKAYKLISEAVTLLAEIDRPAPPEDAFRTQVEKIVKDGSNPYTIVGQIMELLEQEAS